MSFLDQLTINGVTNVDPKDGRVITVKVRPDLDTGFMPVFHWKTSDGKDSGTIITETLPYCTYKQGEQNDPVFTFLTKRTSGFLEVTIACRNDVEITKQEHSYLIANSGNAVGTFVVRIFNNGTDQASRYFFIKPDNTVVPFLGKSIPGVMGIVDEYTLADDNYTTICQYTVTIQPQMKCMVIHSHNLGEIFPSALSRPDMLSGIKHTWFQGDHKPWLVNMVAAVVEAFPKLQKRIAAAGRSQTKLTNDYPGRTFEYRWICCIARPGGESHSGTSVERVFETGNPESPKSVYLDWVHKNTPMGITYDETSGMVYDVVYRYTDEHPNHYMLVAFDVDDIVNPALF